MTVDVLVPTLGEAISEATLLQWHKQVGDVVKRGEELAELETAKAVMVLECPANGILLEVLVEAGTVVTPGMHLAVIGKPGESRTPAGVSQPEAKSAEQASPAAVVDRAAVTPPKATFGERQRISPAARRMVRFHGLDLAQIQPARPGARLTTKDVQRYLDTAGSAPAEPSPGAGMDRLPYRRVMLNEVHKAVAASMARSASTIPQFSVSMDVNMASLQAARETAATRGLEATLTAWLVYLTARVLIEQPQVNARFDGDALLIYETANIAVAVATPSGLLAPVIHHAEQRSVADISAELRQLTETARHGRLNLAQISEATFTISNLGMLGVSQFTPLVTPPQAAVLGVGGVHQVLVPRRDGFAFQPVMSLTIAADHRVVDGEGVARFLGGLKQTLETVVFEPG